MWMMARMPASGRQESASHGNYSTKYGVLATSDAGRKILISQLSRSTAQKENRNVKAKSVCTSRSKAWQGRGCRCVLDAGARTRQAGEDHSALVRAAARA